MRVRAGREALPESAGLQAVNHHMGRSFSQINTDDSSSATICVLFLSIDDFIKSRQGRRHSKKLQMQGARILRNEAYIEVRCNDER